MLQPGKYMCTLARCQVRGGRALCTNSRVFHTLVIGLVSWYKPKWFRVLCYNFDGSGDFELAQGWVLYVALWFAMPQTELLWVIVTTNRTTRGLHYCKTRLRKRVLRKRVLRVFRILTHRRRTKIAALDLFSDLSSKAADPRKKGAETSERTNETEARIGIEGNRWLKWEKCAAKAWHIACALDEGFCYRLCYSFS